MGKKAGILGLLAVGIFILALILFAGLNPDFNYLNDYVSKLGAKKQPNAIWFNLTGFLLAGIFLIGFGISYGKLLNDRLVGLLLAIFGVGFSFTAIPFDIELSESSVSKAHTAAITLGLASWLFGLARISYNKSFKKSIRFTANTAAIILVLSIIDHVFGFWSMPLTHRLVFVVVFGWTAFTSINLIIEWRSNKIQKFQNH